MKVSIGMYVSFWVFACQSSSVQCLSCGVGVSVMKKPNLGWVLRACNIG